MIKLMRIDERLIHGQVAFAWSNSLGISCIFIANDSVASDKMRQMTLKLATPSGVSFFAKSMKESIRILNEDKIKKYDVLVLVDNTEDARILCENVKEIKSINVGNMKLTDERKSITRSVAASEKEIEDFKSIIKSGIEVEIREVPIDKKVFMKDLL